MFSSSPWRPSIAMVIGVSGNSDRNHENPEDGTGLDISGSLDIPIFRSGSIRAEIGRVGWDFDEYGGQGAHRDDHISIRRITVAYVR